MQEIPLPDANILVELVTTKMPYGKYKDLPICNIPARYLEWYANQGFPSGKIGMLLSTIFEIKTNGLEALLTPIKKHYRVY